MISMIFKTLNFDLKIFKNFAFNKIIIIVSTKPKIILIKGVSYEL